MKTNCTFGEAIEAAKKGKRIAREGWNGKGMFVFCQVPAQIPMSVVPSMQSLPDAVKNEFIKRYAQLQQSEQGPESHPHSSIRYKNQMAMVYPDNNIYGWLASPSDVLEEDWCILD